MSEEKMTKQEFDKRFAVVGEFVYRSALVQLEDHSPKLTDDIVIENEEFENNYWAIIRLDDDGFYDETIVDDFESGDEAWAYYDDMRKEMTK